MKPNEGFIARMRDAVAILQTEGPMAATQAIQKALSGATAAEAHKAPEASPWQGEWNLNDVSDMTLNEDSPAVAEAKAALDQTARSAAQDSSAATSSTGQRRGQFITASCSNRAGTRSYKVYIPSCYTTGLALPLVVMLHGCKQNPDDFAAGTGMNQLAEEQRCVIVYPAQAKRANGSNCWNWFRPGDQQRDRGEPSLIADITREVLERYGLDRTRCYIAGLSAGGAMAAIMGANYPDLYAAVGIHSGLPTGAAHNVPSAFAAMKKASNAHGAGKSQTPAIVFHGDRDATVHPLNGQQVVNQHAPAPAGLNRAADAASTVRQGRKPQGRAYTVTLRQDANGKTVTEHWVVHGAGHAWAGGSPKGSYTDPSGPDASREMLRFFYEHSLADEKHSAAA
jgi:poly(hydroxyalkanoate) depolymerase family esterase